MRNIVTIGAPVDVNKMGLFAWVAKMGGGQVEFLAKRIGNVPGGLSSTVFRLLTPMKNVTRYADLFMNMWNREYVNGFDAMNQWVGQFIDYPQGAFLQFTRDFMQKNKMVRGKMRFGGKVADSSRCKPTCSRLPARPTRSRRRAAVRAHRAVGQPPTDVSPRPRRAHGRLRRRTRAGAASGSRPPIGWRRARSARPRSARGAHARAPGRSAAPARGHAHGARAAPPSLMSEDRCCSSPSTS